MGGSERVIITLLRNLNRSNFNITFIVLTKFDDRLRKLVPKDINFIHFKRKSVLHSLPKLIKFIRNRQPHIVFSNLNHLNLAVSICRFLMPKGIKIVARESTIISSNLRAYKYSKCWLILFRLFYRNLDFVVCQSIAMCNDLVKNVKFKRSKVTIIPNPLDLNSILCEANAVKVELGLGLNDKRIKLIGVGKFRSEKRFERLVDAFTHLDHSQYHLTLVGDGPEYNQIKAYASELMLDRHITFVGYKGNPYPYIQAADALIVSSDYEGSPNVVLEAIGLGVAVITTPAIGGVLELVEGYKKSLVADDISALGLRKAIQQAHAKGLFLEKNKIENKILDRHNVVKVTRLYERVFINVCS